MTTDHVKRFTGVLQKIPNRVSIHVKLALGRIVNHLKVEQTVVKEFHKFYYGDRWGTWRNTFFFGHPIAKCPLDLWVYQELIYELRPDVIIECGTYRGGSALFLASMCELVNHGQVVTIDVVERNDNPQHSRIHYLVGSSISPEVIETVAQIVGTQEKVLVILDSDHHQEHVLNELRIYSTFVPKGSYLIVEDTNLNGHPVTPQFGPGPMEAVAEFLQENQDFMIDKTKEKFYLTFNPNGYLKRIASNNLRRISLDDRVTASAALRPAEV